MPVCPVNGVYSMSSLPTIDPYQYESQNNNTKMQTLLGQLFPELKVPYEYVFDILNFLSETNINARIIPKVIRGVHNLLSGTGRGQVIVHVLKDTTNVSIRENDESIKTTMDKELEEENE
jgi:hypothetical protein